MPFGAFGAGVTPGGCRVWRRRRSEEPRPAWSQPRQRPSPGPAWSRRAAVTPCRSSPGPASRDSLADTIRRERRRSHTAPARPWALLPCRYRPALWSDAVPGQETRATTPGSATAGTCRGTSGRRASHVEGIVPRAVAAITASEPVRSRESELTSSSHVSFRLMAMATSAVRRLSRRRRAARRSPAPSCRTASRGASPSAARASRAHRCTSTTAGPRTPACAVRPPPVSPG